MTSAGAPSAARRPFSSSIARVHKLCMAPMLCDTKKIVRPSFFVTSSILPRHFFWNSASPTASTSSTKRISGSRCAATEKARRTYMPLEYRFTGESRNCSMPANYYFAHRRRRNAREYFKKRRLASAVCANDADDIAFLYVEADVAQSPKVLSRFFVGSFSFSPVRERAAEKRCERIAKRQIPAPLVRNAVAFPDIFDLNDWAHMISAKYRSTFLKYTVPMRSMTSAARNDKPTRSQLMGVVSKSPARAVCTTPIIGFIARSHEYAPAMEAG